MHNGSPRVSDDMYVVSLRFYHYYTSFSHCFFPPLPRLSIELYLGVSFRYTASAIAAAIALRSLLRFMFPLFGEQIFDALENRLRHSLLVGVGIVAMIPFPDLDLLLWGGLGRGVILIGR